MDTMNSECNHTYASVDLELTGFDPHTEEIIEIGIAVFRVVEGSIVTIERFESLVRPQKSHVRSRITGLTGITQKDLDGAPLWSEIAGKVTDLLDGVVLVGHGVDLDIRFLRASGIDAFTGVVDTLELSQIFLPTYHSYNLESLGHLFSVAHEGVHRAGGDAEATIGVLKGLMGVYRSLSPQIQAQLCVIAESSGKAWPDLFQSVLVSPQLPSVKESTTLNATTNFKGSPAQSQVVIAGLGEGAPAAVQLATHIPPWSIAFFDREQAFLYAQTYAEAEPYVGAFEYLSTLQLEEMLGEYASLTEKEQLGLMKVLVWKEKFSRFGILSEINWSIIGTEVKKAFTQGFGGRVPQGLVAADFRSLPDIAQARPVWVHRLEDLFDWLSQKSGYSVSWQGFVAGLKQVYNPEIGVGQAAVAGEVEMLLAAVDTYFASALLLVRGSIYRASGSASQEELNGYVWQRLLMGAKSLIARIESSLVYDQSTFLQKQTILLKRFFAEATSKGSVGWIEYSDKNFSYYNKPVQYIEAHRQFVGRAHLVIYQTSILDENVLQYIRSRIGLGSTVVTQGEYAPKTGVIRVRLHQEVSVHGCVSKLLQDDTDSTLVLFPSAEALRGYYDVSYTALLGTVPVLAVGIHGGTHKLFRNFNRSQRSTILSAVSALQSYVGERPEFSRVIYVCPDANNAIPHPYTAAVAADMSVSVTVLEQMQAHIALVRILNSISLKQNAEVHVIEAVGSAHKAGQNAALFLQRQLSTVLHAYEF